MQLAKRHKKALALWVFALTLIALFLLGLLPGVAIFQGESMKPTMGFVGVALIDTKMPFDELKEGDIIAFLYSLPKENAFYEGQSVLLVHRVYYIDEEREVITTLGDNKKEEKECISRILDKEGGKVIATETGKCQQLWFEHVNKNQYIGKIIWWTTIIP